MSRRIIFTAIVILGSIAIKAQDNKVAVFDPAGDVSNSIKEIVREEISAAIVNMANFTVLERSLIDKVLEENKFQAGGLVDDSQISEMGKRMGASYVFVTSITSMGSNYYISCKMIEVLTARIDKQKTTRTANGANDLIDVVQQLMGDMFGSAIPSVATSTSVEPKAQPETQTQPETPTKPEVQVKPEVPKKTEYSKISADELTTDGKRVFLKGNVLDKSDVRRTMSNTNALYFYEKGLNQRILGNILIWTGVSTIVAGSSIVIYTNVLDAEGYWGRDEPWSKFEALNTLAISLSSVGAVEIIVGIVPVCLAKKNIRKSVDLYNGGKQSAQVKYNFGITPRGVGLTINF